jgi:hypothetical protein
MSSTKDRSALNSLLKPEGGPQLCVSCTKAVKVVGIGLLVILLGTIFTVLSFFRGMESVATVGTTALLTLGCTALLTVIAAYALGLPVSIRKKTERPEAEILRTGKKRFNVLVCDGCSSTFEPKD